MKKYRKFLSILFILILGLSIISCSKNTKDTNIETTKKDEPSYTAQESAEAYFNVLVKYDASYAEKINMKKEDVESKKANALTNYKSYLTMPSVSDEDMKGLLDSLLKKIEKVEFKAEVTSETDTSATVVYHIKPMDFTKTLLTTLETTSQSTYEQDSDFWKSYVSNFVKALDDTPFLDKENTITVTLIKSDKYWSLQSASSVEGKLQDGIVNIDGMEELMQEYLGQ